MMEPVLIAACMPADFDAVTQTCSAPVWVMYQPSPFPPLTLEQAAVIGSAIIACWCVGAGFKAIYKAVK